MSLRVAVDEYGLLVLAVAAVVLIAVVVAAFN
jgi:hypothetical protein